MSDRTGGSRGGDDAPRAADNDGFSQRRGAAAGAERGAGGEPGDGLDNGRDDGPDDELDLETPEADAAEQHTDLVQDRDEPPASGADDRGAEADPADLAEQRRVARQDEEDYR